MIYFYLLIRTVGVMLFLSLPPAAFLGLAGGWMAAGVGAAFGFLVFCVGGLKCEELYSWILDAKPAKKFGIRNQEVKISVIPESKSEVLVIRAWGSAGCTFLSQGLLARLTEKQLVALLERCETIKSAPGITLASICSFYATVIEYFIPFRLSTPIASLFALCAQTVAQSLVTLGGTPQRNISGSPHFDLFCALQKAKIFPHHRNFSGMEEVSKIHVVDST